MKEGASSDFENKDKLLSLYLFESSNDPEKLTTLKDYVSRMKEGQTAIYYLTGSSRRAVEHSPHLEALNAKGYEVLYLVDPVDEFVVQWMFEFEGKPLKSVGKGSVDLGEEKDLKEKSAEYASLMEALQRRLEDRVKEVRLSGRLTSSPVCLVVSEQEISPNLEKMLNQAKGESTRQKRIMELNPDHEIVTKMRDRLKGNSDDPLLDDFSQLMMGYALLAEGSELEDPLKFNQAVMSLLGKTL
jgi:molecular chaperone HtpG